MRLIGFHYKNS